MEDNLAIRPQTLQEFEMCLSVVFKKSARFVLINAAISSSLGRDCFLSGVDIEIHWTR